MEGCVVERWKDGGHGGVVEVKRSQVVHMLERSGTGDVNRQICGGCGKVLVQVASKDHVWVHCPAEAGV